MKLNNRWVNGAIPALLTHCSIGSVYAWSLFVNPIAEKINAPIPKVQFAFSLAIFFLGMSAAFGGRIVEKNIFKSSLISIFSFCLGLIITGISVANNSLIGIYLGYGCLMGIGLGVGYITPVKTLMMWFKANKGLGTGIAITGFGFASAIASPIITFLLSKFSLYWTFCLLSLIYFIPMAISSILLKKPYKDIVATNNGFRYSDIIKNPTFLKIWLIMYINISCGLSLISIGSPLLTELKVPTTLIALTISIMGIFNGFGRLILSILSDKLKNRISMYKIILIASIAISGIVLFTRNSIISLVMGSLIIISATYGAGFSCLPTLLSDIYGMNNISKIHGLALTSWAIAGLTGNQVSSLIHNIFGSYNYVYLVLILAYSIALICSMTIKNNKSI